MFRMVTKSEIDEIESCLQEFYLLPDYMKKAIAGIYILVI